MEMFAAIPAMFGAGAGTAAAGGAAGAAGGAALGGASFMSSLASFGQAAGTVLSGASLISQGIAAKNAGKTAQAVAENRAKQAEAESRERASRMNVENRRRLSGIKAMMAGGGVAMSGSSLDFLGEAAARLQTRVQDASRVGMIDANNERYGGQVSAWEGRQAQTAGMLRGVGTLLEGGAAYSRNRQKWGNPS